MDKINQIRIVRYEIINELCHPEPKLDWIKQHLGVLDKLLHN